MEPIVLFGGKFPLSDGVPAIYSADDIIDCCCPVPDTCPCTASAYPCDFLLESYSLDSYFVSYSEDVEYRLAAPGVISNAGPVGVYGLCFWTGNLDIEVRHYSGGEWGEWEDGGSWDFTGYLDTAEARWDLIGDIFRTGKSVGRSPVGFYSGALAPSTPLPDIITASIS
jgi:hypothetical protein